MTVGDVESEISPTVIDRRYSELNRFRYELRLVAGNASTIAGGRLPGVIEYDEQPESLGGIDDTA